MNLDGSFYTMPHPYTHSTSWHSPEHQRNPRPHRNPSPNHVVCDATRELGLLSHFWSRLGTLEPAEGDTLSSTVQGFMSFMLMLPAFAPVYAAQCSPRATIMGSDEKCKL